MRKWQFVKDVFVETVIVGLLVSVGMGMVVSDVSLCRSTLAVGGGGSGNSSGADISRLLLQSRSMGGAGAAAAENSLRGSRSLSSSGDGSSGSSGWSVGDFLFQTECDAPGNSTLSPALCSKCQSTAFDEFAPVS